MKTHLTRYLLLSTFVCGIGYQGFTQIKQEERHFYRDGKNKPFDKEFDLLIPYKDSTTVYFVNLYKHKKKYKFEESLKHDKSRLLVKFVRYEWEKISDTHYLKVKFRDGEGNYYSLLKPSRRYSLIIAQGLTDDAMDLVDALRDEYNRTGTIDETNTNTPARTLFDQILATQRKKKKLQLYESSYKAYAQFYINTLAPIYQKQKVAENTINNYSVPATITTPVAIQGLQTSYRFLFLDADPYKALGLQQTCVDSCELGTLMARMVKINNNNIKAWLTGELSLENLDNAKATTSNLKERAKNLQSSIQEADKYLRYLNDLTMAIAQNAQFTAEFKNLQDVQTQVSDYRTELVGNLQNIVDLEKAKASIASEMIKSRKFKDYVIEGFDSYIYSFKTRNELSITPVFGYAYYGFQEGFSSFTPYLGFQVNFSPLNREDPFRLIPRKTVAQRLCFTTAWTLTPINEEGKRSDLFDKSSLITALGFKFSHVIMANAGTLWFKKEDPSPIKTTKKVTTTPLLSVSINLEIQELLNGFTKLIPVK